MKCKRCGENLKQGKYIHAPEVPDFMYTENAVTLTRGTVGVLRECLKCPDCGWSVTPGGQVLGVNPRQHKQPGWWIESQPRHIRYPLYLILTIMAFGAVWATGVMLMVLMAGVFLWLS